MTREGQKATAIICGSIVGLCFIISIALLVLSAIIDNGKLQSEYNKSVVTCVQQGRSPAECQNALRYTNK